MPLPGLDEAILGGLGASDSGNPEDDSRKIAELLKHGAHCLQAPEAANEQVRAGAVLCMRQRSREACCGRAYVVSSKCDQLVLCARELASGPPTALVQSRARPRTAWRSCMPPTVLPKGSAHPGCASPVLTPPPCCP